MAATLVNNVAAGFSITMPHGGYFYVASPGQTNYGSITLASGTDVEGYLMDSTLTNVGTLDISSAGGSDPPFDIQQGPDNQGTMTISGGSVYADHDIHQDGGTLTVADGATFNPGTLYVSGGTIVDNGTMPCTGDLHADGGAITGNPPTFDYGLYLSGDPTGTIDTYNANLYNDVPAGFDIIAESDLGVSDPITNYGTIELHGGQGHNPNLHGQAIDNKGTIDVEPSQASYHVINADLTNDGDIEVQTGVGVSYGFVNNATIHVSGGSTLSVNDLTQNSGTSPRPTTSCPAPATR